MTQEQAFAHLRNILTELYADETSARRIVNDAGINDKRISFSTRAVDTWHGILREAKHTDKLDALFNMVLRPDEYGGNPKLLEAVAAYHASDSDEYEAQASSTPQPDDTPTSVGALREEKQHADVPHAGDQASEKAKGWKILGTGETEQGFKWWLRFVIVPLIGGGSLLTVVITTIDWVRLSTSVVPRSVTETVTITPTPPPTSTRETLTPTAPSSGTLRTDIPFPPDVLYVRVPAGNFWMGFSEKELSDHGRDIEVNAEKLREQYVDEFWIMTTEVTNAQYQACVAAGECDELINNDKWKQSEWANHPVTNITWEEARIYARAAGGDLPTEEEWEKACRGYWDARIYPWGNFLDLLDDSKVINKTSGLDEPISVDDEKYKNDKSPYGVLGMASNVREYTSSNFNESGSMIVMRGGAFESTSEDMRCAKRFGVARGNKNPVYGFRVIWHSEPGK